MNMLTFNIIVAMCENLGIGFKGNLPWNLKSEMQYFSKITKRVHNTTKYNVVIMGRKTYFSIPQHRRPLSGRLNIILSKTLKPSDLPAEVLVYPNLEMAMCHLDTGDMFADKIENVWIIGGNGLYTEAITSPRCHRLYITKIYKKFICDTFFPSLTGDYQEVTELDNDIPRDIQEENSILYEYKIFEKQHSNKN